MALVNVTVLIVAIVLLSLAIFRSTGEEHKPILGRYVYAIKKYSQSIVVVYLLALIGSAVAFYTLPYQNFLQPVQDRWQAVERAQEGSNNFHELAAKGKVDEFKSHGIRKNNSYSFDAKGKKLKLDYVGADNPYYRIYIERKDSPSAKVEVLSYITPHIIDNIDITERIAPPEFKLVDNKLTIASKKSTLNFARFNKDFTATQFFSGSSDNYSGNYSVFGIQAIYLRVPKNMDVTAEGNFEITYIPEATN